MAISLVQMLNEADSWKRIKDTAKAKLPVQKAKIMDVVLENTRARMLVENASATMAGNIASIQKVIFPMIRRIMPTIIANELVGVQPMTGPTGLISSIRYMYAQTTPADGSGVAAGTEALSPNYLARYYAGNQDVTNPGPAETADLEMQMGQRLKAQIVNEIVKAETMRLSAEWTIEAQQDAQSQYGLNMENELFTAVSQEIVVEIDQFIIGKLMALAGTPAVTWDQAAVSGAGVTVVDEHASLAVVINQQANQIARKIRFGAANWAVVSTDVQTVLESARDSAFATTTKIDTQEPTNTRFVGTLNNRVKVYVNTYANGATPVLLGFKGDSEYKSGAYYCPYVPLSSPGSVMDYRTGSFITPLFTRFGYVEMNNTASSLGNAKDFYSKIAVSNMKFF